MSNTNQFLPEKLPVSQTKVSRLHALDHNDIQFRDEREEIVKTGVKASIAASKAIYEIYTYQKGALWKTDYATIEDYLKHKWGIEKSQGYRLINVGGFIVDCEQHFSHKWENFPVNAGQVLELSKHVPKHLRVECWSGITAEHPVANLTGTMVATAAEKFLKAKGVEPKTTKRTQPAQTDDRKRAARDAAKLRTSLSKLPFPERFEQLLDEISLRIEQDPVVTTNTTEPPAGDRGLKIDPALISEGLLTIHDSEPECEETPVMTQQQGRISAEQVVEAMVVVAPPFESSMATATAETEIISSHGLRDSSFTAISNRSKTSVPESHSDAAQFMNAQLFHAVLRPGEDYGKWSAYISATHSADVRVPDAGGALKLSLIRAKYLAFHDNGISRSKFMSLIDEATQSHNGNPGATADSLFENYALLSDSAAPDDERDLRLSDACADSASEHRD